jgi:co-chaperonin GroES (HSP10)
VRLIPHGFTILIEPDPQPEQTDSGLILMPEDRTHIATSGIVVAVGKGSKRLWEARQKAYQLARRVTLDTVKLWFAGGFQDALQEIETDLNALVATSAPAPSVQVGDRVVFAAEAGLTVQDDGKDYILLEEDRVVIVVEEEDAVA